MEATIINLKVTMAACLFVLGTSSCIAGVWAILARRYQQVLKSISAQSAKISSKAITDVAVAPIIESMSGLVTAINQLVRTSVGVGVFLCLSGVTLCLAAFWMLSTV
jgi:hypothetical protein